MAQNEPSIVVNDPPTDKKLVKKRSKSHSGIGSRFKGFIKKTGKGSKKAWGKVKGGVLYEGEPDEQTGQYTVLALPWARGRARSRSIGDKSTRYEPPPKTLTNPTADAISNITALKEKGVFDAIDEHAKNAPNSQAMTIAALCAYLIGPAKTDLEKIRAFFTWITTHISYDVALYQTRKISIMKASDVLAKRSAVCEGYATLFNTLAHEAKLESYKIGGRASGSSFDASVSTDSELSHAWNAVRIYGNFYLIDCTWGAGFVEGGKFTFSFCPYFFCTPPRQFIYTHFPQWSEWQLLDKQLTDAEFDALPYLQNYFFDRHICFVNHPEGKIQFSSGETLDIQIAAPTNIQCFAALKQVGSDDKIPQWVLHQEALGSDQNMHEFFVRFPKMGKYIFQLFTRTDDFEDDKSYQLTLSYKIECTSKDVEAVRFPKTFPQFNENGHRLISPLEGDLKAGSQTFTITKGNALAMSVSIDGKFKPMTLQSTTFALNIDIASGTKKVTVMGKYTKDSNKFYGLAEYSIM